MKCLNHEMVNGNGRNSPTMYDAQPTDDEVLYKGVENVTNDDQLTTPLFLFLLIVTALISAYQVRRRSEFAHRSEFFGQNSVIPSLGAYACLPYGRLTYHLALTIGNIANPIACLLPSWINVRPRHAIAVFAPITCKRVDCRVDKCYCDQFSQPSTRRT
jgi:hypothetical protein